MSVEDDLIRRATEYVNRYGLSLSDKLGRGVHGIVFATESKPKMGAVVVHSAIKVHERDSFHFRERDVYLRLKQIGVTSIQGCHVPQLLRFDSGLQVIEMTVVTRPFVLDFAGANLGQAPDFTEEVIEDWRTEKAEQFGKRWPDVQVILRELEGYGVFMEDVSPSNIALPEIAPRAHE